MLRGCRRLIIPLTTQPANSFWILCWPERDRLCGHSLLPPRDQAADAGGARLHLWRAHQPPCRLSAAQLDPVVDQAVRLLPARRQARAFVSPRGLLRWTRGRSFGCALGCLDSLRQGEGWILHSGSCQLAGIAILFPDLLFSVHVALGMSCNSVLPPSKYHPKTSTKS